MANESIACVEESTSRSLDETQLQISLNVDASARRSQYTTEEKPEATGVNSAQARDFLTVVPFTACVPSS